MKTALTLVARSCVPEAIVVLAGKNANGSPCFLTLDLSVDCELDDRPFYTASDWELLPRNKGGVPLGADITSPWLGSSYGLPQQQPFLSSLIGCPFGKFWVASGYALNAVLEGQQ